MINIHKQLWVVKGFERKVNSSDYLLSYMTHTEYTKDNVETVSFQGRKSTGNNWAQPYRQKSKQLSELTFDNNPVEGFRIVDSVSRWSTSNKLIQVEDPRGFVVEVPTGNLTTLLKYVTVERATIKGDCVWGREGGNHILLPINSEIYTKAYNQTELNKEKVSFSKLKVGQTIKFSVDDTTEYVYLGRGKAKWNVLTKQALKHESSFSYCGAHYRISSDDATVNEEQLIDKKYCFIFRSKDKPYKEFGWEYKTSGKCIILSAVKKVPLIELFEVWIPERVKESYSVGRVDQITGRYWGAVTIGFDMKSE